MTDRTRGRHDPKVNVKVVLSGMWVSTLLVFAYVDMFGFWREDVINGALDGKVPGAGFDINQTFLALTTLYVLVPSLMVTFTLVAPARVNRATNLVVSLLYAASVIVGAIGEAWAYYIIGSVAEVLLLLTIAAVAWNWPTSEEPAREHSAGGTRRHVGRAKIRNPVIPTSPAAAGTGQQVADGGWEQVADEGADRVTHTARDQDPNQTATASSATSLRTPRRCGTGGRTTARSAPGPARCPAPRRCRPAPATHSG